MLRRIPIILLLIFCANLYSQEIDESLIKNIDPKLLENLSSEQLKELTDMNNKDLEEKGNNNSPIKKNDLKLEINQTNSTVFGHTFVNSLPVSLSIEPNIPLTNDYRLSLGDELKIILSGSKKDILDLKVKLDGTIFFPDIGSISVGGKDSNKKN